jgi:hypothetical protein
MYKAIYSIKVDWFQRNREKIGRGVGGGIFLLVNIKLIEI